jgi:hypothetical protein
MPTRSAQLSNFVDSSAYMTIDGKWRAHKAFSLVLCRSRDDAVLAASLFVLATGTYSGEDDQAIGSIIVFG